MPTDGADDTTDIPAEGAVLSAERTFTVEEVREFGRITGDDQSIHADTDDDGHLIVQGLLAGSVMTSLGGDLNYIARTMDFEFRKPVRTGEPISCDCTVVSKTEREDRYQLDFDVQFSNDRGETVIQAESTGLIRKPDSD